MHISFLLLLFFFQISFFLQNVWLLRSFSFFFFYRTCTDPRCHPSHVRSRVDARMERGPQRADQVEHGAKHQSGRQGKAITGLLVGRCGCS